MTGYLTNDLLNTYDNFRHQRSPSFSDTLICCISCGVWWAKRGQTLAQKYNNTFLQKRQFFLEVIMDENQGYVIRQSVLFDNGRGIALGEHPREGFVTWQFTEEKGRRDYYWGHYYDDGAAAEKDYIDRAADYQRRFGVREVKRPIAQQMREAAEQAGERPAPPRREAPDRGDR